MVKEEVVGEVGLEPALEVELLAEPLTRMLSEGEHMVAEQGLYLRRQWPSDS